MPDISLITSLYRSEQHLNTYRERLVGALDLVAAAGIKVEVVIVANDPSTTEFYLLEKLTEHVKHFQMQIITTERESLYASWNRGIEASEGQMIGVWNVDDMRTAEGLISGHRLLSAGADLVDFPYWVRQGKQETRFEAPYDPAQIHPRKALGTFFMMTRALYDKAGAFDADFRIAGDFEWSARDAVRSARYEASDVPGGTFIQHGGNLSGASNPREWVEFNLVLLRHGVYEALRPVDPQMMKDAWLNWAGRPQDLIIPGTVIDWLMGEGAQARYEAYHRERRQPAWFRRVRLALARRGLIKSAEWSAEHQKPFASTTAGETLS